MFVALQTYIAEPNYTDSEEFKDRYISMIIIEKNYNKK